MRNVYRGIGLGALMLISHLAMAAPTPSQSGTTIPSAAEIVDSQSNTWTLSGGVVYENGAKTPSAGVILMLDFGGQVYQENVHHNWWVWGEKPVNAWVASSDPRVTSPSGTMLPAATQIIDGALNVWTVSNGQVYEHGQLTPSGGVILLYYAKGVVYQENIHRNWWLWRNGAWVATAAPLLPSARGMTIPSATELVDDQLDVWTLSGGQAYENHSLTPSSSVILLLFYGGTIYQENIHHNWWGWNGQAWIATASDPRAAQPLAYVASTTAGAPSVTVINTGTMRVTHTIPIGFKVSYLVVTPDAKHVYAAGASNTSYGSVAVIDTAQNSVVTNLRVPYTPQGIVASPDGTKIYILTDSLMDSGTSTLSTIATSSNTVSATLHIPADGYGGLNVSPDGKELYMPAFLSCGCASYQNSAYIQVIDTSSNSLAEKFVIPSIYGSSQDYVYDAVISPDNSKLYSNHSYEYQSSVNEIAILNPATGTELTTIPDVLTVGIFSPDSQHLYGVGLGGVGVINTATEIPTTAVANIPGASQLAITPDGKHLYITDVGTGAVYVADTATYTVSTVIPVTLAASGAIAIVSPY